ncbi:ABC transporter B family member 29, chloroplastic isoform X1 [Dendrobium catenatum]|uniref:ABC transporter B family member 29, chloroplastic isoform X1 n=2 Tax=Dendrobium catenatum TaxID=906689 RepID=UPI0009F43F75|nr:ABC transporter B family member 29, chloroplastic isoform X1 [Dendrobium catenatum]
MAQLFYRTCSLSPLHSPPSFSSSKTQTLFAPITPSPFPYPLPFSSSSSKLFCLDPLRFQSPRFSSSSSFDRIKPYLQSEWEPILKGWVCSVVSVCCLSVAVPKAGQIPSILTSVGSDRMVAEGLALATLAFARSAATYLQHAFLWEAALGAAFRIRAYVFGRVIESDLGFFEGNAGVEAGDVAHRLTSEASDVADMLYSLLNTVVPNTLQFLVMATQMVMLSPPLAFVSALGVPCLLLVIGYLGERLRGISRRAQITAAKLSSYVNEVLPLMLVVKANNGELNENLHFCRLAHDDLIARLGKKKLKAVIPQIVQVIYIGGLIVLHAISLNALKGSMDGSRLLSFTMSLALLIDPIQGMGKAFNELKEGEPAVERLFELAQFHNKVVEKPNALDLCHVTGDIKFSGVTFRYGDNMPLILNELDILIKRGERVAFIGRSGGGKTTIVKLLLRLYDPLYGDIFLDDYNIQEVKLRNLREHIVLIPQDTMLFLGTVAENIGYKDASGKLDMECVENAAKIANADEFIRELPNGYQTNIGLRGSLLSGGQRQRIAIARALYRKSSILILDEATSALDSKSEQLFSQALEPLMTNNTVLIIAHRIETMMMADRVLLVEGGKVEEVPKSSILSPDGHLASLLNSFADTGRKN